MSNVLIKGMEMPVDCWECKFKSDSPYCSVMGRDVEPYLGVCRPEWCPLVGPMRVLPAEGMINRQVIVLIPDVGAYEGRVVQHIVEDTKMDPRYDIMSTLGVEFRWDAEQVSIKDIFDVLMSFDKEAKP